MKKNDILEKLNVKDPYPYIKSLQLDETISPDWGGTAKIFEELILKHSPKLILELGAFLGDSTITMGSVLKNNNIDGLIITVDTWLGSQEHWLQNKCNLLHLYDNFEHGISTLYDKCLTNFIKHDVNDYIIPIPIPTSVAFDIFSELDIKFDMIYMDADHEQEVVYSDLKKYHTLLNKNGVLFGHDIDWNGVKCAVDTFSKEHSMIYRIETDNDGTEKFWIFD